MYLQVTDGRAELAVFVILCDEGETVLCFSQDELEGQQALLDEAGTIYTVEPVSWTDEQRQTITGKIYSSADEARQDLNGTRIPTVQELINSLQSQLAGEKEQREMMQTALDDVIFGGGL